MQQIHSCIDIDATPSLVWAILTDFGSYKRWNPFIRAIVGKPSNGNALRVTFQCPGRAPASTTSTLTYLREPRELRWRQRRLAPGLYTTEHRFRIESLPAGGVRFHQTEQIQGLFAALVGRGSQRSTAESFHAMNHALKSRAERMGARLSEAGDETVFD
ncbi:MAG: Polyketide cyclase/dehydrase [Burkholderiaceae bacterium]|nr:Polyketide cyclase/dehydrase [Burkholderiaceae bacterium]